MNKLIEEQIKNIVKDFENKVADSTLTVIDYGCDGISDACCGNCGGEHISEYAVTNWIEKAIPTFLTQFLTTEIERLNKDEMVEYYRGYEQGSLAEYEQGYLDAIEDQITHLESIKQELL